MDHPSSLLPDHNNTNFPLAVSNMLSKVKPDNAYLKFHQKLVKEYFLGNLNQRGLLVYHKMGSGKTISAMTIANYYRELGSRKIIILLAKSLVGNFKKNAKDYLIATTKEELKDEDIDKAIEQFKFISLNASNMFDQVNRLDMSKEEKEFEARLEGFVETVSKKDALEGSLLIIDEAHNLLNAITNGSKNAVALYDMIMNTKDIRLLFLTGTPVVNDPFELVPCFNMLRGLQHGQTLFSEMFDEFRAYFVDQERQVIKNKSRFTNRIYGLISYYGDLTNPGKEARKGYPEKKPIKVEKIPMSQQQFARYILMRDLEREEGTFKGKQTRIRFSGQIGFVSTYRVKSRQISNFLMPECALGPSKRFHSREKYIDKLTDKDLLNFKQNSPKLGRMMENVKKSKGLGVIYSQFVSGEGIAVIARVLEAKGYESWHTRKQKGGLEDFGLTSGGKTLRYAMLTGDIPPDERDKVIHTFNKDDNKTGSIIQLLLLSGAVAEGISLKNVRHIHIFEPFWNYARIEQVIDRAVRYLSHESLPKNERNVQPYVYLSDYPDKYPKEKITELTTDIELFVNSIKNKHIINSFMRAVAEASVDCTAHVKDTDAKKSTLNCKLCAPTNKQLYHPLLAKDMQLPDPCEEVKKGKIKVKEIDVDSVKYYYSASGRDVTLYEYREDLGGYIRLGQEHPIYQKLLEAVMDKI